MAASYPASIKSFTTKTNKQDDNDAADINDIQDEVTAIETELGADVAGSTTNLVTRLDLLQDSDGALAKGTSFPVSPAPIDGQIFYRTDQNTASIYNGSSWDALGQSLSNVIFAWSGNESYQSASHGTDIGTSLAPVNSSIAVSFFVTSNSAYKTFLNFKFYKIASISTISIHSRLWSANSTSNQSAILNVDIGGQSNTVDSGTATTPTWITATTIDVSGLSDTTLYDGIVQLKAEGSNVVACSAITLIAS